MTRIRARALISLITALAVLWAAGSRAQSVPAGIDPETVPEQPWYPKGYRDLRIAAAGEIATFPRDPQDLMRSGEYNLLPCNDKFPDNALHLALELAVREEYAAVALDVSRIRAEMRSLGYPADVFEQPLLDFERSRLGEALVNPMEPPSGIVRIDPLVEQRRTAALIELAEVLEARRQAQQSGRPIIYHSCPYPVTSYSFLERVPEPVSERGPDDVAVVISPPNGRLWLINGFKFRVCERKGSDPWNHIACGWEEYWAGDGSHSSGRYIYEVRWPDGTVRRGARIIEFDPRDRSQVIRFDRD